MAKTTLTYNTKLDLIRAALNDKLTVKQGDYIYVDDADDANAYYCLGGKTYSIPYSIDADRKVTLGDSVEVAEVSTYEPVAPAKFVRFANVGEGELVYKGPLWQIGEYADKRFGMTIAEADERIANFKPIPNDLEHSDTILSGKLGSTYELWREGDWLHGTVGIPEWLGKEVGDKPIGVSMQFHRATKNPESLALTIDPRVEGAQIVAAFKRSIGPHPVAPQPPSPTGRGEDLAARAAETPTAGATAGRKTGGKPMNIGERIAQFFNKDLGINLDQEVGGGSGHPVTPADDAKFTAEKSRADALAVQVAALQESCLDQEAIAFADDVIKVKHLALEPERAGIVASFKLAAKADALAENKACFSGEGGKLTEGTNLKAIRDQYAARKPHKLVGEQITAVTFSSDKTENVDLHKLAAENYNRNGRASAGRGN
jgi:hypothetical protein